MHQSLQKFVDSLASLEQLILTHPNTEVPFNQTHGWNWSLLSPKDLVEVPSLLRFHITQANLETLDSFYHQKVESFTAKIELLKSSTVPYIFNGNGANAIPVFMEAFSLFNTVLSPILFFQPLQDNKYMPTNLLRRLKGIDADLKALTPNKEQLEEQIKVINDATEAAETLPTDLQSLKDARGKIEKLSSESAESQVKISLYEEQSKTASLSLQNKLKEANSIVSQCEEAYRIATSTGLAGAFEYRAKRLSTSINWWVLILIIALICGATVGYFRLENLSELMKEKDESWGIILMHAILSVLSVGAPLWLAWLSTKQIGQRFRLSEDYAFKASVAKAYEGYRKEANRIDKDLEKRLFSSALSRLEETPLRLIADDHHGSPWHEALNSKALDNLMSLPQNLLNGSKKNKVDEIVE